MCTSEGVVDGKAAKTDWRRNAAPTLHGQSGEGAGSRASDTRQTRGERAEGGGRDRTEFAGERPCGTVLGGVRKAFYEQRKTFLEAKLDAHRSFDKTMITLSAGALSLSVAFLKQGIFHLTDTILILLFGTWCCFAFHSQRSLAPSWLARGPGKRLWTVRIEPSRGRKRRMETFIPA